MELEEQVTSLELSRELKDNGYPQEGLWWWVRHFGHLSINIHKEGALCVAPTVAELINNMSEKIQILHIGLLTGGYAVTYETKEKKTNLNMETDKNLANAFAKMWLYLKKEGLLGGGDTHELSRT